MKDTIVPDIAFLIPALSKHLEPFAELYCLETFAFCEHCLGDYSKRDRKLHTLESVSFKRTNTYLLEAFLELREPEILAVAEGVFFNCS